MAARELTRLRVPVLMYHGLTRTTPAAGDRYSVRLQRFRDQLRLIRDHGYGVSSLEQLFSVPGSRQNVRTVILTFDDGKASDYECAFPLLRDLRMTAHFFVNTATLGTPGYLTWSQVREMQHGGMHFGSHSHDHVALSRLSGDTLRSQLRRSKDILEHGLGTAVEYLAAPYGFVNQEVIRAAAAAGYRRVCTSNSWPASSDAQTINRIAVYSDTTLAEFERLIAQDTLIFLGRSVRSALLYVPKELLLRLRPQRLGVQVLEEQA